MPDRIPRRESVAADDRGFLAPDRSLLDEGYLLFDYVFQTAHDPLAAALHLCREQSTALWRRPGVDEDYRPRHAARLVELRELPSGQAWARIAHPAVNFGARLPNMLTAAGGEGTFFTPGIDAIRLEDVTFPEAFLAEFEGPRFGLEGLRELAGVRGRPFVWGVIKPNIGLPIDAFAAIGYEALAGGADVVKDDEMLADPPYSPLRNRARAVFDGVRRAAAETGEGKLFFANITDEVDRLLALHDAVHALGGRHAGIMLNALPVGLSACRMVARHTRVPMVAHFDLIAAFSRIPGHGISERVMTRLQRLAGFDAIIMPGLGGRMHTTNEEVVANVRACLEPMGPIRPVLPIPGGSDWAGSLAPMRYVLGHVDFGFICGRGIFGHPRGAAAGARSVRQAWDAIARGDDPRQSSASELREAFEAFG